MAGATDVIIKAIRDARYRDLLLSDPDRALKGYRLSSAEVAQIKKLDARKFEAAVGKISRDMQARIRRGGPEIGDARLKALDYPVIEDTN